MKIVYAVDVYHPRLNGVITCIDASLRFLAQKGHELYLICPGGYPLQNIYPSPLEGIARIYRLSSYPIWFTTNKEDRQIYPWELLRARKILKDIQPDLIHIHTEFDIGRTAKAYALRHKIPVVATAHTHYLPYAKGYFPYIPLWLIEFIIPRLIRSFYKNIDITLTPTSEMKNILQDTLNIPSPVQTCFIGIDTSVFKSFDKEKERKNSYYFGMFPRWKNRRRLLFVGRIAPEKNIILLLHAFKCILAKNSEIELIIVGSGSYFDHYIKKAESMGLSTNVSFTGPIPHHNLHSIYAIADIFTFPSLTETQGLVTLEALYMGLPVVAVNALGTKIVMENSQGGFLVKNNAKEFAEKVLLLLKDQRLYNLKRQEAIKRAQELTFEKTGEQLLKIYQKAIALHLKNKKSL